MPTAVGVMADSYNAPASGGATPPMTGLDVWWDAVDAATITASAGAVTRWNNKGASGTSQDLTVKAGAGTITTGTRTINGKNVIDFVPQVSISTSSGYSKAQPVTMFAVIQSDTATGDHYIVGHAGGSPSMIILTGKWALYGGAILSGTTANTSAHVFSCVYQGASSQIWIDGVSNVSGNAGTTGFGSQIPLGAAGGSAGWDGVIGEVLIYNVALDTTTRQQVESYLTAKWITPAGFSPLSIPWHSAFWASDPGWVPPADGAAVADWKNSGTAAANATQATGANQPVYRAAYTNLNGKPAIDFVSTDRLVSTFAAIAQPNHVFVVGWQDPLHGTTPVIMDGATGTRHYIRNDGSGGALILLAGATLTNSGGGVDGPFALAALFSTPSAARVNGVAFPSGNAGTNGLSNLTIGAASNGTTPYLGAIAFLGVSDTELTAQQVTDLETWAKNYYGVPVATWTPASLGAALYGWWDASDPATITDAGTPLVGSVSQWNDKSGNARHLIQTTNTAYRPVTGTRTINGKNALDYDSSIQPQQLSVAGCTITQPFTWAAVVQWDVGGTKNFMTGASVFFRGSPWNISAGVSMNSVAADTSPHVMVGVFNGATSEIRKDGVSMIVGDAGTGGLAAAGFSVGRNTAATAWDGLIGEVIACTGLLSGSDMTSLETYLKTKWGIA